MRNVNKIFWLTALSLAFVACQNEDIVNEQIQQGTDVYTLQGIVNGSNAQSRAQVQLNRKEVDTEFFIWNQDDKFSVFDIDVATLTGNTFSISENYQNDDPQKEAFFTTETPMTTGHKVVAVYPVPNNTTEGNNLTLSLSSEMILDGSDMDTQWREYMRQNMFMYAPSTEVTSSTALSFGHLCALARITYTNATNDVQTLTRCELAGTGTFFASAVTLDVKTGKNSDVTGTKELGINFMNLNIDPGYSQDIYLLFFPGIDFVEGGKLTCKIYLGEDSTPITAEMEVSKIKENNNGSTGFEAGKRYWFQVMQTKEDGLIWKSAVKEGVISNMALIKQISQFMDHQYELVLDDNGFIDIEQSEAALGSVERISGYFDNLEGLEYLPNLTYLYCGGGNKLSKLDVSKNENLETLICYNTSLLTLDVSNNPKLITLDCSSNLLTSLDLSNNTELTNLACFDNQLTVLYISKATKLTQIECGNNQLTSLDVSNNPELTYINCDNNLLSSLFISPNSALTTLYCNDNQLTSLDISNATDLRAIYCWNNQLTDLDISNNINLTVLQCDGNDLSSLDITQNPQLSTLTCGGSSRLSHLDISQNKNLDYLDISYTAIQTLDVTEHTALTDLFCGGLNLSSLDISKNTALQRLRCFDSSLTSLDLSNNENLIELNCNNCRLQELDITNNPKLEYVTCGNQRDKNGNGINLTLFLTSDQQAKWESDWSNNWENGRVNLEIPEE